MSDILLTVSQTAEYLKVCDKTVRRLITNQALIAFKVGSSWRIRKADIDKYLFNHVNSIKGVCNNE